MVQTLAFLIRNDEWVDRQAIRSAQNFGYRIADGIEAGDEASFDGIKAFVKKRAADLSAVYLDDSGGLGIPDAFNTYKELSTSRAGASRFEQFLTYLTSVNFPGHDSYLISCTEWQADDEAIYLDGTASELRSYLRINRTFGVPLWNPETDRVQDSDRYPFVFRFIKRCL